MPSPQTLSSDVLDELCKQVIQRRLDILVRKKDELLRQYPTIRPFSARKQFYEGKILPIDTVERKYRSYLSQKARLSPEGDWEVLFSRLGAENAIIYYLDCFYTQPAVTAPRAVVK